MVFDLVVGLGKGITEVGLLASSWVRSKLAEKIRRSHCHRHLERMMVWDFSQTQRQSRRCSPKKGHSFCLSWVGSFEKYVRWILRSI